MTDQQRFECPDCGDGLNRRHFVKVMGAGALAAGGLGAIAPRAFAAPSMKSSAETAAAKLYGTLTDEQRKTVCLPWDDAKRTKISANWDITKPGVGSNFYSKEQQGLIREVFKGVCSEDGHGRFMKQLDEDAGGFDFYTMALFGEPGNGKFEWTMTGRHLTIRADGDSVEGMAFGGPIVYGHGESDPAKNLYHYQTQRANEVFAALDPKQREAALLEDAPKENNVPLRGAKAQFPGLAAKELSGDQKKLLVKTLKAVLGPYRNEDVEEAMAVIEAGGGVDALHIAFYKQGDLKNDGVWDVWRVEGPSFVSHFRGAPHVHAYIHVGTKTS